MYTIAYVVSTLRRSGPINQLYNIIKHLDRSIFTPVVITLSPEPENSMLKEFQSLDCQFYSLNLSRFQGFFFAKKRLASQFREINPDIVHSSGVRGDNLCQKILGNSIHVMSIRNFPQEDYLVKYGFFLGSFLAFTHYRVLRKASHALACSKALSSKFKDKKGISLGHIQNGVDTTLFVPLKSDTDKNRLKKKYGYAPGDTLIIYTGSLIPRKNVSMIIKAFMKNKQKDNRLLILGDGIERSALEHCARPDRRVRFPGYTTDVTEYLQMSDYFVSASFSEGLPNSVMEAMACGLPVILSDIAAHRELVESLQWPFIFRPDDVQALERIFHSLDTKERDALSSAMRHISETCFSARIMSENYQKLYKEIIK